MESQNNNSKIIMHPASVEELVKRKNVIQIKPYSVKEFSILYGVSRITFCTWLKPIRKKIGQRIGRYYSVKQVEVIFKHLGVPYTHEFKSGLDAA
jgi:hypothetical protein